MRSTNAKDFLNLIVKANWGFSSTMSRGRGEGVGRTQVLSKTCPTSNSESTKFNDSIVSLNSTYLEVVDPGNRLRGVNTFFGLMALPAMLMFYWLGTGGLFKFGEIPFIVYCLLLLAWVVTLPVIVAINILLRWDMFRKTHYPMRFNRRNRKVYAWSQDMGVVTMNWDDIQFYTSQSTASEDRRGLARDEIRGFVKDHHGNMVHHLVFFKYQGKKNMQGVLEIWELVRRYMEEPDGHIQAYNVNQRLLDVEGKRESFIHSLIQATRFMADSPLMAAVLAPMVMWAGTGRIIAKWTCRVPHWPEWVEEKCKVASDDPYVRNRHNEPLLSLKEVLWPLFCYLLGWAEVLVILYFCFG